MFIICLFWCVVLARAAVKQAVTDGHCTDPRTMRKHAAYTEWADAYSCTRHRCQPGGRNLAIYTVGCKRVEAPESAIECEEVVEDTNMQFPYCCTRLRCLVVVRGEVWTRVLGQPWETLPAAPWSHMYKMKKPPPVDSFLPKGGPAAGPVYELAEDKDKPTDRRAGEKDCDKPVVRAQSAAAPDIVIALTTDSDNKKLNDDITSQFLPQVDDRNDAPNDIDAEEMPTITEKVPEILSEEHISIPDKKTEREHKLFPDIPSDDETPNYGGEKDSGLPKPAETSSDETYNMNKRAKKPRSWARIAQEQWNPNPRTRTQSQLTDELEKDHDNKNSQVLPGDSEEKQEEKPASLQHLVNAIGTRMRDIENVVQQMSEKVQPPVESVEQYKLRAERSMPRTKDLAADIEALGKPKTPNSSNYNRFPPQQGTSTYLRGRVDSSTEPPLFVSNLSGYFSDPANNLLRRAMRPKGPKEPQETYTAPINTERKKSPDTDGEPEVKHKKHTHKKKKSKHGKKKHRREAREKKKFSKIPPEQEKNAVSLEDSDDLGTGGNKTTEDLLPLQSSAQHKLKPIWIDLPTVNQRQMLTHRPMVTYLPIPTQRPIKYRLNRRLMLNYLPIPTHRLMHHMAYRPKPKYLPIPTNKAVANYRAMATQRPMAKYLPVMAEYFSTSRPIEDDPSLATDQPTNDQSVTDRSHEDYLSSATDRATSYRSIQPMNDQSVTDRSDEDYSSSTTHRTTKYRSIQPMNDQSVTDRSDEDYLSSATDRTTNYRSTVTNTLDEDYLSVATTRPILNYRPILESPYRNIRAPQFSHLLSTLKKSQLLSDMRNFKKYRHRPL